MENTELDLKALIAIVKRQRRLIIRTLVIVVGLGLVYALIAKPVYQASTLLLVDSSKSNILDPQERDQQQSQILNSVVDSEVEILNSDATALAVVKEADLLSDPSFGPQLGYFDKLMIALGMEQNIDGLRRFLGMGERQPPSEQALVDSAVRKLQAAVDVRRKGLTYLISISVTSGDPDKATRIANIYAQTYLQRQVAAKTNATIQARDVLRRQIDTAQANLAASETAVNSFIDQNLSRLENESGDPAVAALRQELEAARNNQSEANSKLISAEGAIQDGNWATVANTLGDTALAALAAQRDALKARLGEVAEGSSKAIDLKAELDKLDADLKSKSAETLGSVRQEMAAQTKRVSDARDQLRNSLLQSDLSAEMLTDLFNLQQTATNARNQYQTLLAREQDLGTLANLQIADARIVSEALPQTVPVAPNIKLILTLAVVGGMGLGLMLAFVNEYYIGGVVSASQLENILQTRVPMTVPQLSSVEAGTSVADLIVTAPMSVYAEAFRKLRATIDVTAERALASAGFDDLDARAEPAPRRGQVILVCSALKAEGKTTSAISLARTYAMSGLRTLLIDSDLRKPAVAHRLGIEESHGLLKYLTAKAPAELDDLEATSDTLSPLVVLAAGERSSEPTDQLINSAAFRSLIQMARENFDVVILDSPPLLPVVDARYLARYADTIVQVVRYATTTQGEVREAYAQLQEILPVGAAYFGVLSHEERGNRTGGYYGRYAYYGESDA